MAFFNVIRKKKSLIGLDIGSYAAKVLKLKCSKETFTVQSVGIAQYPIGSFDGPHIADIKSVGNSIKKLWENLGLREKKVAIAVPGNEIITEMPEIPSMKRSSVFSYIDANAREFIAYSPDEVFYGIDVIKEDHGGNTLTLLIAYARRGIVYDYEKLTDLAGLEFFLADVDYFALFNAFEATEGISDEVVALIDIGASKTIIVIVHDKIPVLTRSFLFGANELVFQLTDKFGFSISQAYNILIGGGDAKRLFIPEPEMKAILSFFIDQIAGEIRNVLDYFYAMHKGSGIQKIFLSGGMARSPGIAFQLEKNLGIPVVIFNPLSYNKVRTESYIDPEYVKAIGPQMAICFGLALRQEEDDKK